MIWLFLLVLLLMIGIAGGGLSYLQGQEAARTRMRFISTVAHGMLDYFLGILLIGMPWLLGFAAGGAETWIPVVLGGGLIFYSLFTDYKWGIVRRIPMPYHLALDGVVGLFLFASPFLFGFWDAVMDPHLGMGLVEMSLALFTRLRPASPSGTYSSPKEEGQQE